MSAAGQMLLSAAVHKILEDHDVFMNPRSDASSILSLLQEQF